MRNLRLGLQWTIMILATVAAVQADESARNLLQTALEASPEYTIPVLDIHGEPVTIEYDFNHDGLTDVAILMVANEAGVDRQQSVLSRRTRLYRSPERIPLFVVETYLQNDAAIHTLEIGRYPVLISMSLISDPADETNPAIIRVDTEDTDAAVTDLLIYDRSGTVSRFQAINSQTRRTIIRESDPAGGFQIITLDRFPEAGRGYETYVEQHLITEAGVVRSASFPMVRELNGFLAGIGQAMASGDWQRIGEAVAWEARVNATEDPVVIAQSEDRSLDRVFVELDGEDLTASTNRSFDLDSLESGVTSVHFPDFLADPFPGEGLGEAFQIVFRVDCCEGQSRYFRGVLKLSEDPFAGARFAFLTDAGARQ